MNLNLKKLIISATLLTTLFMSGLTFATAPSDSSQKVDPNESQARPETIHREVNCLKMLPLPLRIMAEVAKHLRQLHQSATKN